MSTTSISSTIPSNVNGTAKNVGSDGTAKASDSLSNKNQFLMLLVNELRNQDPTAPTDQKETLSQLAQFSQLEQMQNLNQTLSASNGFSQVSQSATLIGKTVSTATDTSAGISGVVSSVSLSGGKTYLHVGTQDVDASTITGIQA
jgi:flagellar basal-body rod modification protein FlgD